MASTLGRADTVSLDTVRVMGVLAAVVVVKLRVTPVRASVTALLLLVIATPSTVNTASQESCKFDEAKGRLVVSLLLSVKPLDAPSGPVTIIWYAEPVY